MAQKKGDVCNLMDIIGLDAKNEKTETDQLVYKLQYHRGLNPGFIILTLHGIVLGILMYFAFGHFEGGMVTAIVFLGAFFYVYKFKFPYRYYQTGKIPLLATILDFLTNKRKKPYTSRPLNYSYEDKQK